MDPSDEIGALVQNLHTTQRRLQELTVGQVDAVIHPGGHAYLLHKAQEKLQVSEAVQRQLAETMADILNALPAHIALLNAEGVIVSVNDIWRQFATANDLQGPEFSVKQNYLEICERVTGDCAEDARRVAAGIRAVLAGTTSSFRLEYPCHSPTQQRWFMLLVTPVRKDRPAGAVVMHIDITERKLAEELVRESEERFRSMFTTAATGIAVSTPDGRFLAANAAYCRMLGYTEEEMRELNFAVLTHPDDLDLNLKLRDEVLAGTRDSFVMEKRYVHKNGDIIWTRHSVSASRTTEGKIAKFVVVAEDITERKLAEEQLMWKTAFFEAQAHSSLDGILIVDSKGKTVLQNERLIELWNLPGAFAVMDDKPQRLDIVASQVKNRQEFLEKVEWLYAHPEEISRDEIELINGTILDRDSAPVRGQDGKYYGRIWSFRDITERKRAESRLLRLNRLHKVLSEVGGAVARTRNRQELYDTVCRIVTEEGRLRMVFIAEVDAAAGLARPIASYGDGQGYLREAMRVIPLEGTPMSLGPVCTAIRTGVTDFCNDIAGASRMQPWHEVARKYGLRANAAVPFYLRGTTIGVLALYADVTGYFQDDEVRLVVSVANDISFTLEAQEKEKERQQFENSLRHSEERLRLITNLVPHGIFAKDSAGRHIFANQTLAEMAGLTVEEILGKDDYDLVSDRAEAEAFRADDFAVIRSGKKKVIAEETRTDLSGRTRVLQTIKIPFTVAETGEPAVLGVCMDITERKQAEEALQRRQVELQVLFDLMPSMVWFKDTKNNILRVNQRGAEATGLTIAEMEGKSMYEVFPQEAEKYYADDLEVIQSRAPKLGIIEQLRDREGTELWVQTDKVPVCDKAGNAIGVVVMVQDITERKLAELQAAKQIELIEMASRVGKLGAWAIEWPGPKVIWSEEVYRIHEVERDFQPNLESALDFFPSGSREKLAAAVEKKEAYDLELDFVTDKGKRLWVRTTCEAETVDGEVRLYGIFQDITERKRTEERFRRLVDSNAQGVFLWNTKGKIIGANDAFLHLVRSTREELEAGHLSWADMTPPEFEQVDRQALDELAARGVCASYEKEFMLKDGSRVPILLGAALFQDNTDEGVCFVLDLTERKKLEQQFLRAQRMESIGTLAGGIAHDLNNVLAPITMAIDLLKMKFTDKSSQDLLATLGSSAQRGAEMVGQVLSFARGVEGRRMDVQVKHLLKDIEKLANDTFPKIIQVRSFIPNELWTIVGDPTQLHQVLLNLCVNARDAMPNGGTLTISAENAHLDEHYAGLNPDAHPGAYTVLQITDTGTGMPPGIIEKIFDPFFTTKEIGKGTGLGLSTSLAIVKSHGGFIRVYSEPGKGTTFKAYFPGQTELSAEAEAEVAAELPRGNGELILIVDDEANVRQITRQTLEAFGYRVVVASDGAEAVAIVARQDSEIAVVLTDMMMPVMDGPATIQVLRRLNPHLPIIAASGLSADGRVTQAAGLGVKHFLSKPYSADALLQVLRQILSAK